MVEVCNIRNRFKQLFSKDFRVDQNNNMHNQKLYKEGTLNLKFGNLMIMQNCQCLLSKNINDCLSFII